MNKQYLSLYTSAQTRELDRLVIDSGVTGYSLMKKAGTSAFHFILSNWPDSRKMIVVCGIGNNGGDGYVIAKLAKIRGMDIKVVQLGDISKQQADSVSARQDLYAEGIKPEPFEHQDFSDADLIIDALLGTGIQRNVTGEWKTVIEAINRSPAKVASVDIPSGLNADTGVIQGVAVKADITVTFIGRKQGMYTADGCGQSGYITFDSLNIDDKFYQQLLPASFLLQSLTPALLKSRDNNSHKGQFGNVLVVGGAPGMSGAVLLSAEAALRTGCGLVTVLTHPDHATYLNLTRPEIMCTGIDGDTNITTQISNADVVVIGPGLGTDTWGEAVFNTVIAESSKNNTPLVIDADGLNNLSSNLQNDLQGITSKKVQIKSPTGNWVLTPHPGEAARLLGCNIEDVQQDRFSAAKKISEQFNAVCVLKGAGTLVHTVEGVTVCAHGNPGMSTAGMGDVLSGILGTLLAQDNKQGASDFKNGFIEATNNAVALHAMAGDIVAEKYGEKGMIASDLFPEIRGLINEKKPAASACGD